MRFKRVFNLTANPLEFVERSGYNDGEGWCFNRSIKEVQINQIVTFCCRPEGGDYADVALVYLRVE